jgi:hypothetical protein
MVFCLGEASEFFSFLCLEAEKVRYKVISIQRIYNLFILIIFIVNKFLR